jgi:hypothetical protein
MQRAVTFVGKLSSIQCIHVTAASGSSRREHNVEAHGMHHPVHCPAPVLFQNEMESATVFQFASLNGSIDINGQIDARCEWWRWLSSSSSPSHKPIRLFTSV